MPHERTAPWEPYKALARAKDLRGRARHDASPITEPNAHRTWGAEDRCTDDQLDAVFMLLSDYGAMSQHDLARDLADLLGLRLGTARGAVSGALFTLQSWDLAEWSGEFEETEAGKRSRVWRVRS